jgi:PAS domain S-box-containing protein
VTRLILRLERLQDGATAPAPTRHVVDLGDHNRAAATPANGAPVATPLARWVAAAAAAHDPCLVLDVDGRIASLSAAGAELLGCSDAGVIGRRLLDVIHLVDFDTGAIRPEYAARISPLAVLAPGSGLMRSLIRIQREPGDRLTLDASAAPLHDAQGTTVGSFAFLAPVRG